MIIPVFNVTEYLPAAVDSVRGSFDGPLEVIVVDDGSDAAGAIEVIDSLPEVVVIRQENRGLPAARNTALRRAGGDYILPLDADDLVAPHFLPLAAAALTADEDLAYVTGYVRNFGVLSACVPPLGYVPDLSLVVNTFGRASALFRREVLLDCGGYNEKLDIGEDWDLYLRLHDLGYNGDVLPVEGLLYRRHPASMTFATNDGQRRRLLQYFLRLYAPKLPPERLVHLVELVTDLWRTGYEPSISREYLAQEVEHLRAGSGMSASA